MDSAVKPAVASLEVRRLINAPRQQVFNAWADEQQLACWMGPTDEMETIVEAHDFRVDGEYRYRLITRHDDPLRGPAGVNHVAAGIFVEVNEPERLTFTWQWVENGMDMDETLVTLDFIDLGDKTELVLLHEKLPNDEAVEAHREGWEGCLACLDRYITNVS